MVHKHHRTTNHRARGRFFCSSRFIFRGTDILRKLPYANDYDKPRIEIFVDVHIATDDNINADAHALIDANVDPGGWC